MARERKGLSGSKKVIPEVLEDYFGELEINKTEEKVDKEVKETQKEELEIIDDALSAKDTPPVLTEETSSLIDKLAKENNDMAVSTPSIKVKGGKLTITSSVKPVKFTKADFLALSKDNKYNLQKKNEDNAKQLSTNTKTVSIRPDLLAIFNEIANGQYGLQTKLINNALIKELISLGILEKDSESEITPY